jgi:ER degradation enhancer, mannosidase alpha-like 2
MKPKSVCRGLGMIPLLAFAATATVSGTRPASMESFFFAETLKYLYFLLGTPNTINPKTTVLNTEAHPLRRTW